MHPQRPQLQLKIKLAVNNCPPLILIRFHQNNKPQRLPLKISPAALHRNHRPFNVQFPYQQLQRHQSNVTEYNLPLITARVNDYHEKDLFMQDQHQRKRRLRITSKKKQQIFSELMKKQKWTNSKDGWIEGKDLPPGMYNYNFFIIEIR